MVRQAKRKRGPSPANEEAAGSDAKREKASAGEQGDGAAAEDGGAEAAGSSAAADAAELEVSGITPASQKDAGPGAKGRLMSSFEGFLTVVGGMYYNGDTAARTKGHPKRDPSILPLQRRSTLGIITSPVRREKPLENWNPREIAAFEATICAAGKNFHAIQKQVKTKTTKEIIEFFYLWKKTSHYDEWKKIYEKEYEIVDE